MKPPRWGLLSLTLDRVPSAQGAGHKSCHCAQVTTILCFQPLGCLCDKGRWGGCPQLCTLDVPEGVGRAANAQGSRGTSSLVNGTC